MKTLLIALLAAALTTGSVAQDFFRNLPDPKFSAQLTPQSFPNVDGVIIFKEQSLNVHLADVGYRGLDLKGIGMTRTTVMIVKVFNEAAVRRFGSFEFEYNEPFGDEIKSGFMARARVQKPDGTVIVMPSDDVSIVVSHSNSDGEPLARKALFKVPDLMAGDVIQLEYVLTEPFVRAYSGIFYYQDRMPTLFSNLAITCQARDDIRVFSFPPEIIGDPKISQIATTLGSGQTRYWSVKNLNAIPREPHGPPFEELSIMTAFVADPLYHDKTDWNLLGKEFWDRYLDAGSVKGSRVTDLGFAGPQGPVTRAMVDSLYTSLRKSITLTAVNEVYPLVDRLDEVFEKKSGDASDLAAIFYKILRKWEVNAGAVWIRDRRKGTFEMSVPTVRWFDRLGVLVHVGGAEILYDFDRAIPARFSTPWFLKGITAMVIDGKGCHPMTTPASKPGEAWIRESHQLTFGEKFAIKDSMVTTGLGSPVEEWREAGYALKGTELSSYLQQAAAARCIEGQGEIHYSPILDEREVKVAVAGNSKSTVTVIDNFVSVRPANHILSALQEELYAPSRTNHVVLDEPMAMTVEEKIHHPAGYVLAEIPKDTTIGGFTGGTGSITYKRTGDDAVMTVQLDLKTQIIPPKDFSSMMRLLIGLQRTSEQAVTFRKK